MVVAGDEWKLGCAQLSAGVVALMGDKLLANVVGAIECMLCGKKGPWLKALGVLFPLYCCCGDRFELQGSFDCQVYPALPACESGDEPPVMAMGEVCRWTPLSATDRPAPRVSMKNPLVSRDTFC